MLFNGKISEYANLPVQILPGTYGNISIRNHRSEKQLKNDPLVSTVRLYSAHVDPTGVTSRRTSSEIRILLRNSGRGKMELAPPVR